MIEILAIATTIGIVWAMHRAEQAQDGLLKSTLGLLAIVLMCAGLASIFGRILGP